MRRSAAPSQWGPAKRQKFVSPVFKPITNQSSSSTAVPANGLNNIHRSVITGASKFTCDEESNQCRIDRRIGSLICGKDESSLSSNAKIPPKESIPESTLRKKSDTLALLMKKSWKPPQASLLARDEQPRVPLSPVTFTPAADDLNHNSDVSNLSDGEENYTPWGKEYPADNLDNAVLENSITISTSRTCGFNEPKSDSSAKISFSNEDCTPKRSTPQNRSNIFKSNQSPTEVFNKVEDEISKAHPLQNRHTLPTLVASHLHPQSNNNLVPPSKNNFSGSSARLGSPAVSGSTPSTPAPDSRYFSVMWCKASKKKHKKWEGDAVMSTAGRSVTLYDMEGKIIGRGTGYKVAELQTLSEDQTLFVGDKEIQVMSLLTEEAFKSGKCFSAASGACDTGTSSAIVSVTKGSFKPFANPLLKNKAGYHKLPTSDKPVCQPKYDITAENALVMPRPTPDQQWRSSSTKNLPIVDVVVDPYLAHFLRAHQREGVTFLYMCVMGLREHGGLGAILADDMGLGKTLQCITLIWTLLKQGPYGGKPTVKKVLVITPGSLVKNWYLEFKKWLGTERLNVYAVSADKRADDYVKSTMHPVMVISYEMFVRCYEVIKQVAFDLIICDEGHRLKNTAIKTTALIMSLPCRRRVVLTGTPVQNDLQEFFSIVEFCNPGILGSSSAFRRVYEDPIVASRQPRASAQERELGAERAGELTRLTHMFVLRRTQEVNNDYLPPKVELVLFCRPAPLQLRVYQILLSSQLVRHCLKQSTTINTNSVGAAHLAVIGALKQACNHPRLTFNKAVADSLKSADGEQDSIYSDILSLFPPNYDPNSASIHESGKLYVLSCILASIWSNSSKDKVVLVSNHTKTLDLLQTFCASRGYTFLRLDGQTPTAQRQDLVSRFNKLSTHRIFLLSSKAGGVGLNLVGASRLVLYDIDWNPANDLQAMARVWRDGQKGRVYIYRLLTTGSIEEKVYQRQISKQGLSGAVMDLASHTSSKSVQFSLDELKDLFSLNDSTDCETHEMLKCGCDGEPNYEPPTQPTATDSESRSCQLGSKRKDKAQASNLTMAQLFSWKHWRGEHAHLEKGWYLEEAEDTLSYVFWNESNS